MIGIVAQKLGYLARAALPRAPCTAGATTTQSTAVVAPSKKSNDGCHALPIVHRPKVGRGGIGIELQITARNCAQVDGIGARVSRGNHPTVCPQAAVVRQWCPTKAKRYRYHFVVKYVCG
jgi:hypothetical protein